MWHDMRALYIQKLHNELKRKPNKKHDEISDENLGWEILKTTLAFFVVVAGLVTILLIPV
tara:strand:+ start:346 stop:525 length:180 start_codon:yes stop_codon:yes gene_type:complete